MTPLADNVFKRACWQHGFQSIVIHNYLCKVVFGQIVDYADQQDPEKVALYYKVRKKFLTYKRGTHQDRINRAYTLITKKT